MNLIQFTHRDGIPTLRDSDIMGLFDRMESEGLVDIVFYDGSIRDRETFMGIMKENFLCVVEDKGKAVAFFWLTDRQARSAQIHFCFFEEARGERAHEVGSFVLGEIIKADIVDCLVGYIPKFNVAAVEFFKKIGVRFAGGIPHGIYNHRTGRSEACYVVYFDMVDP